MALRIHIAEDEPRSARLLMQLLEKKLAQPIDFEWSQTPAQAINLLKINTPDLLFLDLELSGRSGFEVLEAIPQRIFPVMVSSARREFAYACFQFGVQAYLLKPHNQEELSVALKHCKRFFPLPH